VRVACLSLDRKSIVEHHRSKGIMAFSETLLEMERLPMVMTDDAKTRKH
jgi:hypothetical protein